MTSDNHHTMEAMHKIHNHHNNHAHEAQVLHAIQARWTVHKQEIESFLANKSLCDDNVRRRKYYSTVELLRLEVEELSSLSKEETHVITEEINDFVKRLRLVPVKRKGSIFSPLEVALRFLGVCGAFVFFGTFFSLPVLLLRVVDIALNRDPFAYWSEAVKHVVVVTFLFLSGIELEVQGLKNEFFSSSCALLTFTHASNLDGFLVAGTCPIRQLAFGKKELFVVPFFSWLSLAIGGVPVDRGNRDRAVQALQRSVDSAKKAKVCIAIAPEGTRSTTGQLLPFKKGAFYMWEELKSPIVPLLLFGAYDLYPVGSWVNRTGVVTVRYLPPLLAEPGLARDDMLKKLRKTMLVSLADCPSTVGKDISLQFRILSTLGNIGSIALNLFWMYRFYHLFAIQKQMSTSSICLWFGSVTVFITAALYVYYVYLVDMGQAKPSKRK